MAVVVVVMGGHTPYSVQEAVVFSALGLMQAGYFWEDQAACLLEC